MNLGKHKQKFTLFLLEKVVMTKNRILTCFVFSWGLCRGYPVHQSLQTASAARLSICRRRLRVCIIRLRHPSRFLIALDGCSAPVVCYLELTNDFRLVSIIGLFGRQEAVLDHLIDTFETRDNDVFVCTFVKSGTTWTQQIINVVGAWAGRYRGRTRGACHFAAFCAIIG